MRYKGLNIPLPRNAAELALLSKWYFGKPLHLSSFSIFKTGGRYEIAEPYNSYHGKGWNFSQGSCDGYDYSGRFWDAGFGELYCGGIATHSYGQFHVKGHRNKIRLEALAKEINKGGGSHGAVRTIFERLAAQSRGRRDWRDSR